MSMAGMVYSHIRGRLKKTAQTTCYHVRDDGDYERGLSQVYTIYTTGQYSGTTTVDVAHYAANGISFTAPATIADAGVGFVTVLTNDVIRIWGSASNDGVYTVTAGGVAGSFTVAPNVVNEGAGAYVTIYKEISISNNCVWDRRTGLMWLRVTTSATKVGEASTGLLNWYDVTRCFTLHPAAADLQMIATSNTLRIIGGAGEVSRYHVGDLLALTGFANAANNLPGYRVLSVTVNGADLDIVISPVNNMLVSEAAGGARSITIVCRSIYSFCSGAIVANLGGYADWRIPGCTSMVALMDFEAPNALPNAVAFPTTWLTSNFYWSSTTRPPTTTNGIAVNYNNGQMTFDAKTAQYWTVLVRGGI